MYCNILVPLDGSPFSEQALPLALNIAERAAATIHATLVHTPIVALYSGSELAADPSLDAMVRERHKAYLADVVKRLAATGSVQVSPALLEGPIADALVEHAIATRSDLIVMATHGRGPFSRFWLGSVADKLIRRMRMPVLLVRPGEKPADLAARPLLQQILIPLDGSKLAEQILAPATELGALMSSQYTLLRVVEPIVLPEFTYRGAGIPNEADRIALRKAETEGQSYLDSVAHQLRARSFQVNTRLIVNRPAAVAIAEATTTSSIDLIALETRGRGGMARLMLGSVADKVIRGAPSAVLVHHPVAK
jgi:nucleotide-binding universal stress UspA family protein